VPGRRHGNWLAEARAQLEMDLPKDR